jgi:acyl-CoA synthetase (AMP-forming)/AMP-acid ligase II
VVPHDVSALFKRRGVREAAAVALPDRQLEQRAVVHVTAADPARSKAAIAPIMPYDLAPMAADGPAVVAMTPTGKIAKAELRERALAEGGA